MMWSVRSPGSILVWSAYACAAMLVVILFAALRMPNLGVVFVPDGASVTVTASDTHRFIASLKPDDAVVFSSAAGRLHAVAAQLAPDYAPTGDPAEISHWYAERTRLAEIGRAAPASLTLPVAGRLQTVRLHPKPRSLADLSSDVWLLLGQGCVIGLLGVLVAVLRPNDAAPRIFALSCFGVLVAAFSGALFDARELTADGTLLKWMQGLNFGGSDICGAGIVALYLDQPRRLTPWQASLALVFVAALGGVANGLGWLPLPFFYGESLLLSVLFCGVLCMQWVRAQGDPQARAVLRWVGVTTFVGMTGLSIAMAAPQLLHLPSLGGDGLSFAPLFIVYGGIAFGIGQYRLLDLDRWSYRLILGAAGALTLLAGDALLVGVLGLSGPAALAIAILAVGYLYLPARAFLWRMISGRPALSESELFQVAAEVAFTSDAAERRSRWRALLVRLFDPLEITPLQDGPQVPSREAGGVELVLPAAADDTGLVLRYRAKGRKLFDFGQVKLAGELVDLMRKAERTRDEYSRGVTEERHRIARDLHDDVSARLLTSLHRDDVALVRSDVRKAMSDIRTIVSSLTGGQLSLDQVMADLRFETAERLGSAQIALDWPLPGTAYDAWPLEYGTYKSLVSSHREIISNILRHAGAGRVTVSAHTTAGTLHMSVEDDGRGVEAGAGAGNGLRNIGYRLDQIGGACRMIPCAQGARIELTIPLREGA